MSLATISEAFRTVFSRPPYVLLALLATTLMAVLYAFAGQLVTVFPDGSLFWELTRQKLIPVMVLSALFGPALALHTYAFATAVARWKDAGTSLFSGIVGLGSLSCCASLLPALLAFAGFSGTALLGLSAFFRQHWLMITAISAGLLVFSVCSASKSICAKTCMPVT